MLRKKEKSAISPAFTDPLLQTWCDKVSYVGAFSTHDNWLRGWANFDPQHAEY